MKKRKPKHYKEILETLLELHKSYPSYSMGKHLSTALDEYGDVWGISDKEMLFALTKYKAQMEMDVEHETDEEEIQKIINDGMNLSSSVYEEDEDENEYI
jgi:hypothetical protein